MRTEYQRAPFNGPWAAGSAGNEEDAIRAGQALRAAVDLMDEAWWGRALDLGDHAIFPRIERGLPGSIIVNGRGQRFFNGASPYVNVVHAMYDPHDQGVPDIPSWFVFDHRYRTRYPYSQVPPTENCSASVMGNAYPRQGATLRPAMAFGHVAGNQLAEVVVST